MWIIKHLSLSSNSLLVNNLIQQINLLCLTEKWLQRDNYINLN